MPTKPPFDPSKPYEVANKPAFDPNKPFQEAGKEHMQDAIEPDSLPEDLLMIGSLLKAGIKPLSRGVGYLAEKTGINKIPDRIMQSAMGMKKYVPGVGNTLIDEGLVGTQGMLKKQTEKKLASRGNELTSAVKEIPQPVSSHSVAESVRGAAPAYQTTGGIIPDASKPALDAIESRAIDIGSRGVIQPSEALSLKRIAQREGYSAGEPLSKLKSKLAQREANGYGQVLENAYADNFPGSVNKVAEANHRLSALLKGQKGLNTPQTTETRIKDLAKLGVKTAIGGKLAGPAGMLAGAAASTSLGKSLGAQALQKGGQAASKVLDPVALKSLLDFFRDQTDERNIK